MSGILVTQKNMIFLPPAPAEEAIEESGRQAGIKMKALMPANPAHHLSPWTSPKNKKFTFGFLLLKGEGEEEKAQAQASRLHFSPAL